MSQEAGEDLRKGRTPKGYIPADVSLGHKVKNFMTVIKRWGAIGLHNRLQK